MLIIKSEKKKQWKEENGQKNYKYLGILEAELILQTNENVSQNQAQQ